MEKFLRFYCQGSRTDVQIGTSRKFLACNIVLIGAGLGASGATVQFWTVLAAGRAIKVEYGPDFKRPEVCPFDNCAGPSVLAPYTQRARRQVCVLYASVVCGDWAERKAIKIVASNEICVEDSRARHGRSCCVVR